MDGKPIDWFFFEGTPPGDDLIGDLSGWDSTYKLILGNEIGGARAWKGDLYLLLWLGLLILDFVYFDGIK